VTAAADVGRVRRKEHAEFPAGDEHALRLVVSEADLGETLE
jgi:hypothetical protein